MDGIVVTQKDSTFPGHANKMCQKVSSYFGFHFYDYRGNFLMHQRVFHFVLSVCRIWLCPMIYNSPPVPQVQ